MPIERWQLPTGAFYGTERGLSMDILLDAIIDENSKATLKYAPVTEIWHVTGPNDHWMFWEEKDARACYEDKQGKANAENAAERAVGINLHPVYYRIYQHTQAIEDTRQAKLRSQFDAAAVRAREHFAKEATRVAYDMKHWSDALSLAARKYGERHGLLGREGGSDGAE